MESKDDKVNFRRADIDDIQILIDFRVRFLNELYNHPEDDETKALRKALQDYFSEAIPTNNFIAWLAERDGEVIGISGMVVWRIPGRYKGIESGRFGYILNMYTIPEARGKGICTRLLNLLIEEAKAMGLKQLHLHASEEGINIYKKAGFIEPDLPELELKLK